MKKQKIIVLLVVGFILLTLFASVGCKSKETIKTQITETSEVEKATETQKESQKTRITQEQTTLIEEPTEDNFFKANGFLSYEGIYFLYDEEIFFEVSENEKFLLLFSSMGDITVRKHEWGSSRIKELLFLSPEVVKEVYGEHFRVVSGGKTEEVLVGGRIFYSQLYVLIGPLDTYYQEDQTKIDTYFTVGEDLYCITLTCSDGFEDVYFRALAELLASIRTF